MRFLYEVNMPKPTETDSEISQAKLKVSKLLHIYKLHGQTKLH